VLAVAFPVGSRGARRTSSARPSPKRASLDSKLRRSKETDRKTRDVLKSSGELVKAAQQLEGVAGSGEQVARALEQIERNLPEGFWIESFTSDWLAVDQLRVTRADPRPTVRIVGRAREGTESIAGLLETYVDNLRKRLPQAELVYAPGASGDKFTLDFTLFAPPKEQPPPGREGQVARGSQHYWQENKRFLTSVGIGVIVFTAAWMLIDNYLGADLRAQSSRKTKLESDLKAPDVLERRPRCREVRQRGAGRRVQETARARRLRRAGPSSAWSAAFPRPRATSPCSNARARTCARAGPRRALDPRDDRHCRPSRRRRKSSSADASKRSTRSSRRSPSRSSAASRASTRSASSSTRACSRASRFDDLERTEIEMELIGAPAPLTKWLVALQREHNGRVLLVHKASIESAHAKHDEVKAEATLLVAH
jgi:hypothetical protein